MATIQQQIAEKFLAKLSESRDVDVEKVAKLRSLMAGGKKPKAEDLANIFSMPSGSDLK
jgi:hypothetical protein